MPTLSQVLGNLGPSLVSIVAAPRGLDVEVGDPLIYDSIERSTIEANSILLAIALDASSADAKQLLKEAGAAKAAAAVFKPRGSAVDLSSESEEAKVAIVSIPDEMSWSQLHEILRAACSSAPDQRGIHGISSVPSGDLFALSNAIAALMKGAVSIEDPSGRILAYSNLGHPIDDVRQQGILGRKVIDTPGNREVYRQLWGADGVLEVDTIADLDLVPRLAVAVRAGDEVLGSIWVIAPRPASRTAKNTLAEAARIAAMHIIQARSSRDLDRRMRAELVHSLLEGRGSESAAARLGISPNNSVAVMAFELGQSDPAQEELNRERLIDLIAVYCEAFRHPAACVAMGRTAYVVVSVPKKSGRDRLKKLAREIMNHARGILNHPLRVAIGSTVTKLTEIPAARREADRVLAVMSPDTSESDVATIEDLRSRAILAELRDIAAASPQLMQGKIQKVLDFDAEEGTPYTLTIETYLESLGDVAAGASKLKVHPNTFRYRLRRIRETFDLDLDDPDERLVMALQLRLLKKPASL